MLISYSLENLQSLMSVMSMEVIVKVSNINLSLSRFLGKHGYFTLPLKRRATSNRGNMSLTIKNKNTY